MKLLGRPEPTKIWPLLIVTRKAEQAKHLTWLAKQLCKSLNSTVRGKVFINRYLTTTEAEAAYCVRVQGRQMTVQHADHPTSVHTDNLKSRETEYKVAGSDLQ